MCLEAWPLKSYSHRTAGITNQELNTLKSEQFLYKEIPPFTQDLAQVTTEMESLTPNKISAKLIGIVKSFMYVKEKEGLSQI